MLLEFNVQGELQALKAVIDLAFTELAKDRKIAGVKGWMETTKDEEVPVLKLASYIGEDKKSWNLFPVPLDEEEVYKLVLKWLNSQDRRKLPSDPWADGDVFGFYAEVEDTYPACFLSINPVLIGIGK